MFNVEFLTTVGVKSACSKLRKMTTAALFGMFILGSAYLLYWALAMNDDVILKYTQQYFLPFASFVFPTMEPLEIYRSTGRVLFELMFPTLLFYYAIDKIEEFFISKIAAYNDKINAARVYQSYIQKEKQYDEIKEYSVCISLDYVSKRQFNEDEKKKLSKYFFEKISENIKLSPVKVEIDTNLSMLTVYSENFRQYDYVYDKILDQLEKLKKESIDKFDIKIISNITSDAIKKNENIETAKRNHANITSFHLESKELATAPFVKKYSRLNFGKYHTDPIGEYMSLEKNSSMYELSKIYKKCEKD